MTHIDIVSGKDWTAVISKIGGSFNVAFGYIDSDGFSCVKPSRDYKSEAGARRAAEKWAKR